METFSASDGVRLAYYIDDFSEPWRSAPILLLLHAAAVRTATNGSAIRKALIDTECVTVVVSYHSSPRLHKLAAAITTAEMALWFDAAGNNCRRAGRPASRIAEYRESHHERSRDWPGLNRLATTARSRRCGRPWPSLAPGMLTQGRHLQGRILPERSSHAPAEWSVRRSGLHPHGEGDYGNRLRLRRGQS